MNPDTKKKRLSYCSYMSICLNLSIYLAIYISTIISIVARKVSKVLGTDIEFTQK
jgi:hypothetical protein